MISYTSNADRRDVGGEVVSKNTTQVNAPSRHTMPGKTAKDKLGVGHVLFTRLVEAKLLTRVKRSPRHAAPYYFDPQEVAKVAELLRQYNISKSRAISKYGVSQSVIERLIALGLISELRVGGLRYLKRDELEQFSETLHGFRVGTAATILGEKPDKVRRLIYRGLLPARRIEGGHWRINMADIAYYQQTYRR